MSNFEKIASVVNQFPEAMKAGMRVGFAEMEKRAALSPAEIGALLGGGAGALGGGLYGGLGEGGSLAQALGYGLGGGALGAGAGYGLGGLTGAPEEAVASSTRTGASEQSQETDLSNILEFVRRTGKDPLSLFRRGT